MTNLVVKTNAIAPTNIEQAISLAKFMSESKLVPLHLQGKPADCLLVIEQAMRWEMSPFAVAQCTSVIHNRLMFEGKLVAAVVNTNGNLQKRLSYKYEGEGENRKIIVSGQMQGENETREVEVVLKDVKTTNEQWKKQPDQQLMYSGVRTWARRHTPELMLGVSTPEEDLADARSQVIESVPIVVSQVAEAPANPETGEVSPHTVVIHLTEENAADWMTWGKHYSSALRASKTPEEFEAWIQKNAISMNNVAKDAPQIHARICSIIETERKRVNT